MKLFFSLVLIGILVIIGFSVLRTCNDTAEVVHKEFDPSALLKKYEYFKDLSAAIDKKRADIEYYKEQIKDETDKTELLQLKAEARGIISVHNSLCSEYNAAMSKFNYRFTNRGDLPQSNLEPLPREYKPYILSLKKLKTK
jgi:hypothetical protein